MTESKWENPPKEEVRGPQVGDQKLYLDKCLNGIGWKWYIGEYLEKEDWYRKKTQKWYPTKSFTKMKKVKGFYGKKSVNVSRWAPFKAWAILDSKLLLGWLKFKANLKEAKAKRIAKRKAMSTTLPLMDLR